MTGQTGEVERPDKAMKFCYVMCATNSQETLKQLAAGMSKLKREITTNVYKLQIKHNVPELLTLQTWDKITCHITEKKKDCYCQHTTIFSRSTGRAAAVKLN